MTELFIDDLIGNYYLRVGNNYNISFIPGQLVWTYFLYNYENLEIWRPADIDDTRTIVKYFEIQSSPSDMFRRKYPLIDPPLEINEEFMVIRAKPRPAVILTPPPPEIPIRKIRRGRKINLDLCLLAPLFSVVDEKGKQKYPSEFIDRVRRLEYNHLFFMPGNYEKNLRDSIVRFDRIFSLYKNHLKPIDLRLEGEACRLFFDQLRSFLIGGENGLYEKAYSLINNNANSENTT